MKSAGEYAFDDFLKETEESLEELSDMEEYLGEDLALDDETLQNESPDTLPDIQTESVRTDGRMEIHISEDDMTAVADFYPPEGEGEPLSPEAVKIEVADSHISHGLDWAAIGDAVGECNNSGEKVAGVVIARGRQCRNAVPAHFAIVDELQRKYNSPVADSGRVDFKSRSPFILVGEGDTLAVLQERQEGIEGFTVYGDVIPYGEVKNVYPQPGNNTRREDDKIVAACDGRFETEGIDFHVNKVLQIDNDVDYSTGHLKFPGDIILNGEIRDGFKVHAQGSIFCSKTVDASEIVAGGDLLVSLGIIGRKSAHVKIRGKLKAKFIENCHVEAGDSVFLDAGILNSSVYTSNRIELEKRGLIIGGTVYAQNGVTATQIGTEAGPKTEIHCGTDYRVARKLDWIRNNSLKLAFKLNRIEALLKESPQDNPKAEKLRDTLKNKIRAMNNAAGDLITLLDRNDEAEIVVHGKVFPGVYIEICSISYVVSTEMSKMRFRLNKEKGVILAEKLM